MRSRTEALPDGVSLEETRRGVALLRRAAEIVREDGPLALIDRILGETVYRRLWVFAKRLDEEWPSLEAKIPLECARLAPEEVGELAGLHPDVSVEEARARLARGHRCYVARRRGRLVHAAWLGFGRVWVPYLGCWLVLEPGDAYLYQSWTLSEYRRKGAAAVRAATMLEELRREGWRRVIGAVMPRARAALAVPQAFGYPLCGVIGYYAWGRRRRLFYRPLTVDAPRLRLEERGGNG